MEHVKKKRNSYNAGENNSRWSGGKGSYYKDHYQLKLNRAEKINKLVINVRIVVQMGIL